MGRVSTRTRLHAVRSFVPPLLASSLLAACTFAPQPSLPDPSAVVPPILPPAEFAETAVGDADESVRWWNAFADPALDAVVESALAGSFAMAEAVARVEQARERARVARAAIFPLVGASGSLAGINTPTNAGIGAQLQELGLGGEDGGLGGFTLPDRLSLNTYSLGVDFAYELDFWGRARKDAHAAGAGYLASEWDYQAARIGIVAETIATYFEIVDLRRQIAFAREIVDILVEREELALNRYYRGLADSLDLYRIRQDLRTREAGLPRLANALADAEGRLAVILGGYRRDLERLIPDSSSPSPVPNRVPAGVPADLLLQRPDLRAAKHRLDAAYFAVEARRAELLPSLSLSGSIGLQSSEVAGLFDVDQWFTNLVVNLFAPAFDGGRRRSNVALAEARFNGSAAAYGRAVVTAVGEVEVALSGLRNETARRAILESRLEEARASAALRSQQAAAGTGGYAAYLDALRTRLDVESALATADRDRALARLAVHRALGGAWAAPEPPGAGAPMPPPPEAPTEKDGTRKP